MEFNKLCWFLCGILWFVAACIASFDVGFRMGSRLPVVKDNKKVDIIVLFITIFLEMVVSILCFLKLCI